MSDQKDTSKTPYKSHYYQIVLRCLKAGGVTIQGSGTWVFAIVSLPGMVYRGYEYVQPCLYGRKTAKDAIFGGIQHYQLGLPHNPILKRIYKAWCKENPIEPKHKMKNEILWFYPKDFDALNELITDWPHYEKQRRIDAAEEAAHYEELLASGYFDDYNDDNDYYDEDDYYWENM